MPVWIPVPGGYRDSRDPDGPVLTDAELARRCWADVVARWMKRQHDRVVNGGG
jgi:hypothetical protein